ncbi:SIR2 family protein [Niabella yanshanensis]|uniref:SIR2 family protein n=1 Tax=Niabella yanshanensis TaxID=577386 RepID=A0ABZ0WA52_9BACT|nr:SIR2 family protein [Niabella yanshanensis]WQD39389.1 SIR2 family protein [Niabella yanshanensis]
MAIFFYKGNDNILESEKGNGQKSDQTGKKKIQDSFLKVLDNKNLSFLLGSGCSSYEVREEKKVGPEETPDTPILEVKQIGIPVMAPLAKEFYNLDDFKEQKEWLNKELNIDVSDKTFSTNLEMFLSTLHSLSFYHLRKTKKSEDDKSSDNEEKKEISKPFEELTQAEKIDSIMLLARNFLLKKCLNENNSKENNGTPSNDSPVIELYKQFYRKLLSRNSTLPRLNIFTTNYDLYSEKAMDLLGIHYVNGFTGGISKFFNPAIFNYALAEKMDLSQSKWSVIDNFFYLYKVHGSVNWVEAKGQRQNKLFNVKEIQDPEYARLKDESTIMIHPTPLKYNASLGSPYSDLFREFQRKLMQNNNILVTVGYSFNDEHINNLIFQAFTIPSFRLIVIGQPTEGSAIGQLLDLNDSRIWIIGEADHPDEEGIPIHYFKRFVEEILPDLTAEDLDKKMEDTINKLKELLK